MRIFLLTFLCSACVTTPSKPEFEASRQVEMAPGYDEVPKFALGNHLVSEDGTDVVYASNLTMSGDARPESCLKAAILQAKSEMLKYISEAITSSAQLNETDVTGDPGFESLVASLQTGKISGATTKEQFWQRVEESASSGERILRLKCAVTVGIKRSQLQKQMHDAVANAPRGNSEIRQSLLNAQKSFLDGLTQQDQGLSH